MIKKSIYTILLVVLLAACSSDDSSDTTAYVGPGSEYSISFDNDAATFDLTESDSGLNVTGTFTTLSSGFKKLTIGAIVSGSGPSVGDEGYGVDIPGVVFLLKPLEDGSEIITMVSKGNCPTEDASMNWVVTSIDTGADLTNNCEISPNIGLDSLGTYSYTASSELGQLPFQYDICGNEVSRNVSLGTISCSSGIGEPAGDDDVRMYLTQNGGAIVKLDHVGMEKIIVALPNDSISSIADADGTYIGLVMSEDSATSSVRVFNGKATISSGVMEFDEINPDTGAIITTNGVNGTLTFTGVNTPNDGFLTGTYALDTGGITNKKTSCMFNSNINESGKNFLFCVGQDPTDNSRNFNALFISI